MTEFELLQLVANWSELANLTETTFLTLLFAYLAAAHFVGARLSRLQLVLVTAIYAVAVLRTGRAHLAQLSRILQLGDQLTELQSAYSVHVPTFGPYAIMTIWIAGFAASLLYMRTCRRSEDRVTPLKRDMSPEPE